MNFVFDNEFDFLFDAFFFKRDITPPDSIKTLYLRANEFIFTHSSDIHDHLTIVEKIIHDKMDVVALEFVWRLKYPENALSKKIKILYYIVESHKHFTNDFVNLNSQHRTPKVSIAVELVRSAYRYLKGRYLLRRLEVV